jgi:hypothetical protein
MVLDKKLQKTAKTNKSLSRNYYDLDDTPVDEAPPCHHRWYYPLQPPPRPPSHYRASPAQAPLHPTNQWDRMDASAPMGKCGVPKKTIIPPRTRTQRYHRSKKKYIILVRPKLKRSSIQWILLRHRLLTIHATLYPQPTNPPSYHQTNEPALDFPWLHDISLEIDDALTAFHTTDRHLNNCITTLHHAED